MRKLALFAEGETEVGFAERLLSEIANQSDIVINVTRMYGPKGEGAIVESNYTSRRSDARFYALIYNCGSDEGVLTAILDRLETLRSGGYDLVLGLRDVYPKPRAQHIELVQSASERLQSCGLNAAVVFAVREIEAWFLGETTHFERVSPTLTAGLVLQRLQIDLGTLDVEAVAHPSELLRDIYRLVGRRYRKGRYRQRQTLAALDFDALFVSVPDRAPALAAFISHLSWFFADPPVAQAWGTGRMA